MMKKKIIIFLLIALFNVLNIYTQTNEKLANIILDSVEYSYDGSLSFSLRLSRISDKWKYFANSTIQLDFIGQNDFPFDTSLINVNLRNTDLPTNSSAGGILPTNGYIIDNQVYDGRLSFTFLGPPSFNDCVNVGLNDTINLGSFTLSRKDGKSVPINLQFKKEYSYYQACAYKLASDSLIFGFTKYNTDDNVPMLDFGKVDLSVNFIIRDVIDYGFKLKEFVVNYNGNRRMDIYFSTSSEKNNIGYTILRTPKYNYLDVDPFANENAVIDTVWSYKKGAYYEPKMLSFGNSPNGFQYDHLPDEVQYYGGEYCYQLWAKLFNTESIYDTLVAMTCTRVPAYLIASADYEKIANTEKYLIEYHLIEDGYVEAAIFNLLGQKLSNIYDGSTLLDGTALKERGDRSFIYDGAPYADQSTYIRIYAKPFDVKSPIEEGQAVLKIMNVKEK